ncbi:PPE domain-containing protein [Actinophytocola sp.]|uniref:PPE domain-containing protein n=1 Tax=Actinophytocola sp. TaxID=1872138 RepID=UPI002ED86464
MYTVPDDYDRDREHRTWREAHKPSEKAIQRAGRRTDEKHRNRKASRFGKVNWDVYEHYQLYDMIMKSDPGRMSERAGQWSALAGSIEATTGQVQKVVERVMGNWQGQAAVSAAAANTKLMQWAGTASHTATQIAAGMSNYTEAVIHARHTMPEPAYASAERNFRDGYTVTMTGGPSDAVFLKQLLSDGIVSHQAARERKAEAVAVMESYESRSKDVHDSMPHFSDATPTTRPAAAWTPPPAGSAPGAPSGGGPGQPGYPPPGTPGAGVGVGGATDPYGTTTAAGFADPSFSTGSGSGGPGGTGFGGGIGSLSGNSGDVVRTGPGYGAGAGAGGVGPGALAGRGMVGGVPGAGPGGLGAGARGGAGAFGGLPFGSGAGGDEDKEHKNKYDDGLDLLEDLPPAYPPVFGA